ncbi:ABC transporter substrate-binding protein [Burkholderia sp. Bp8963]|uniref:ABC transporter substrate-binding protein n=1 Tax=Burkholderia sp. Bp8963 TaxID=2184547 RepID=UPI000F5958C2|nr:ABC transporter substrate-binding protein [Burkholderia sp. Bp8963]RQS62611.1 ABC transporter substrate-binding protein [Burkholderia sp. Bp8963]
MPRHDRRHFVALTGALLATAPFSFAVPRALAAGAPPRRGGVLTLLVEPEPPTLLSIANTAGSTLKTSAKTNEGLLAYGFDLKPKPQLATAWQVSPDGLQYRFTLRRGVKWHDGRPFTSADVAFSIGLLKGAHPRGRGTFANVADVRTPDDWTVVVVLSKPSPYLLRAFDAAESPIVPKHLYKDATAQNVASHPNNNAPVGTGPFRFKEWVRGSHVVYERNPDYWDAGKPYIDTLIVKFIPDAAARAVAFESGTVDLGGESPVPLSELARLSANPKLGLETRGYEYSITQTRIEFNLDHPVLGKLPVRQAIAHALDRNVIRNTIWYGYAAESPTPIAPGSPFHDPRPSPYPYDPRRAEALLDAAGYPRGANGKRFALTHDFLPYGDGFRRVADYVRSALARVGIDVTIRAQDFPTYIRRVYTDRAFDFTNNSMGNFFDPTAGVQRLYWSQNFKRGVPFSNGSHYVNPEVDQLLEAAAIESDAARRLDLFKRFQQIVEDELPDINLVALKQVTIANRRVQDHTTTATGLNGSLADVWLAS